jgi:hypothetical protein
LTNFKNIITKTNEDTLNISLEFNEADDYTFRLYEEYCLSDFYQNSSSLFNNFTYNYKYIKKIKKRNIKNNNKNNYYIQKNKQLGESVLSSLFLYSHYFGDNIEEVYKDFLLQNFENLPILINKTRMFSSKSIKSVLTRRSLNNKSFQIKFKPLKTKTKIILPIRSYKKVFGSYSNYKLNSILSYSPLLISFINLCFLQRSKIFNHINFNVDNERFNTMFTKHKH